jgi:hypothetical protein
MESTMQLISYATVGKSMAIQQNLQVHLHKKNIILMDGHLGASAHGRSHEPALRHSTHANS